MTQEEKAKAYDEALGRARAAYNKIRPENTAVKALLEKAFPELAESEDEKIMKMLVELVKNCGELNFTEVSREAALAWLEKQKEQKPIPLTPEILEKNGFYWGFTASEEDFCGAVGCGYPDKGWCYDEGAEEIKIIFPNDLDGGMIRLDDQNVDRHLEIIFVEPMMVNELQHALRLCGIDKEITI